MLRLAVMSAAALFGAAAFAFAGELDDPDRSCDGNTYQIVECQKAKLVLLDKRLAAAYAKALAMAERKQREQLERAQQQWLKFRDANCDYYELGGGTIARVEAG